MSLEFAVALLALLISALAALYARWSWAEAKRSNDMGRLNALLALRAHYLALLEHQVKLADVFKTLPSGMKEVHRTYAELDRKLREVSDQVDGYHARTVHAAGGPLQRSACDAS